MLVAYQCSGFGCHISQACLFGKKNNHFLPKPIMACNIDGCLVAYQYSGLDVIYLELGENKKSRGSIST